ncbi:MAG TPA: hypothetical protein VEB20_10500 [Azospirillaceae bacterium]|nr:hypothetical protein [Azospirillaceae bacterium]
MPDLKEVGVLIDQARSLAKRYRQITGKPLGITGEVAEYEAARLLGLTLTGARMPGYDALRGTERIQIKGRVIGPEAKHGQRLGNIKLDHAWDTVAFVVLDEDLCATEIWEADRLTIEAELRKPGSKARERGAISAHRFKKMGKRTWPVELGGSLTLGDE